MIDPIAITAAALVAKACYEFAGEAGKSTWACAGRLAELLRSRLAGNHRVEYALAQIEKDPNNQVNVSELAQVLEQCFVNDPELRDQLAGLIGELQRDPVVASFTTNLQGGLVQKQVNINTVNGPVSF